MDGTGGCYVKWMKSDRERWMLYDCTYMWNLQNKINEQTKQKQTLRFREVTDGCQVGEGLRDWFKKLKGLRGSNCQLQNSQEM